MKALSIRQPWAWLIVRPDITDRQMRAEYFANDMIKSIENRDWPTKTRGRVLVHASKGMTYREYADVQRFLESISSLNIQLPPASELQRGGIIGSVEIVDCVTQSDSDWFFGRFGFVLSDAHPMPFIKCKGKLGFFDVPEVSA